MAIWSEINRSNIRDDYNIIPDFYQKEKVIAEQELSFTILRQDLQQHFFCRIPKEQKFKTM
jgi:hypothetical protein